MNHKPLELIYADTLEEAISKRDNGYEPVECAFGQESVVGKYILDHHGEYSKEDAISIKAAKLAIEGVFVNKFVVTGRADCDQCYAVAALSGPKIPISLEEATAISELDIDPIGRDRTNERYIQYMMFEQKTNDCSKGYAGSVKAFDTLLEIYNKRYSQEDVRNAIENENQRRKTIGSAVQKFEKEKVCLAVSDTKGFDVWYENAPVAVQYDPVKKSISFGLCPKKGGTLGNKTGFEVIGEKGFSPLYEEFDKILKSNGCGGRDVVGGSPRNQEFSIKDAINLYSFLIGVAK